MWEVATKTFAKECPNLTVFLSELIKEDKLDILTDFISFENCKYDIVWELGCARNHYGLDYSTKWYNLFKVNNLDDFMSRLCIDTLHKQSEFILMTIKLGGSNENVK